MWFNKGILFVASVLVYMEILTEWMKFVCKMESLILTAFFVGKHFYFPKNSVILFTLVMSSVETDIESTAVEFILRIFKVWYKIYEDYHGRYKRL